MCCAVHLCLYVDVVRVVCVYMPVSTICCVAPVYLHFIVSLCGLS